MHTPPHHHFTKRRTVKAERLPDDVILQIITRLPVKSIIRFSFVSKRWRSIITDRPFTKSHYQFASENQTLTRRLLVSTVDPPQLDSFNMETPDKSSVNFNSSVKPRRSVLGSCNGLICVAQENLFIWSLVTIWNPVTGFMHNLPDPYFYLDRFFITGFGYLSATDDYKVLLGGCSDTTKVQVFSLRANIWKTIEGPILHRFRPPGVLLNETLHFKHTKTRLMAFDLAKEEFRSMWLPDFEGTGRRGRDKDKENSSVYDLGVCGGCLYLVHWDPTHKPIGLWVMKEYGVCESWSKLYEFEVSERHTSILLIPLLVMESSSVLARLATGRCGVVRIDHKERKPVIYFVWNSEGEKHVIEINNFGRNLDLIVYEETLLWINGCNGVKEDKVKGLNPTYSC